MFSYSLCYITPAIVLYSRFTHNLFSLLSPTPLSFPLLLSHAFSHIPFFFPYPSSPPLLLLSRIPISSLYTPHPSSLPSSRNVKCHLPLWREPHISFIMFSCLLNSLMVPMMMSPMKLSFLTESFARCNRSKDKSRRIQQVSFLRQL